MFVELQMITEDEVKKEFHTLAWRKIYLNILGGISQKIVKATNKPKVGCHWYFAIKRPDDRILRWAISSIDLGILRELLKK
jgi:hypothetical protein